MAVQIYNTLSRSKEPFEPLDPAMIRMYRCGPTVYKHMHIGHAKTYISFDVVRRYLMHVYGKDHLLYVMNITDVGHLADDSDDGDDKMEVQARRENRSPFEIAASYEESWLEDMDRLNILRADRMPHATDFIRQQIEMAEKLLDKGLAYEVNGSVYFDVAAYEGRGLPEGFVPYGGLSNRRSEDQQHGGRIDVNTEKRAPQDFAIWKKADPDHSMQWYSRWGWGFPGWHLECSVMAQYYLGTTFDIHAGGLDNMFPHHECEIAQSQGANGEPFVRYWMHNNMLNIGGEKMGQSGGNASAVKSLLETFDPMAIRFFILQSHYRATLDFNEDAIASAETGLEKLRGTVRRIREGIGSAEQNGVDAQADALPFMTRFFSAMDDDFNTPLALAALFEGVGEVNKLLAAGDADTALLRGYSRAFQTGFEAILGLDIFSDTTGGGNSRLTEELMNLLIELRMEARARKDFATSDAIRDRLKERGVILEDTKEGTRWVVEQGEIHNE